MTIQSIINQIATHLAAQQAISMSPVSSTCLYRGEGDTKCAVGALIPDSLYHPGIEQNDLVELMGPEFEDDPVQKHIENLACAAGVDLGDFIDFLQKTQRYHDSKCAWSNPNYEDRLTNNTATVENITTDLTAIWSSCQ